MPNTRTHRYLNLMHDQNFKNALPPCSFIPQTACSLRNINSWYLENFKKRIQSDTLTLHVYGDWSLLVLYWYHTVYVTHLSDYCLLHTLIRERILTITGMIIHNKTLQKNSFWTPSILQGNVVFFTKKGLHKWRKISVSLSLFINLYFLRCLNVMNVSQYYMG